MIRRAPLVGLAALMALLEAGPAAAQGRPAVSRDRFEGSLGGLWISGAALGSSDAELRANEITPTPFRLFTTESTASGAPGLDARVGYWLTRTIGVEAGFVRVQPELRTRISGDAEGASDLTVSERIDQYIVDASVVWLVERFRFGRTLPFVSGGAGYLRQLHEGRTLVETGQVFQVGGGVRHPLLSNAGWLRSVGLKLHGRVYVLHAGIQLEDSPRAHGAFSGSIYATF